MNSRRKLCTTERGKKMKPEKLNTFMYGLMKNARCISFVDFLEHWNISEKEYEEIKKWFKEEHEVKL